MSSSLVFENKTVRHMLKKELSNIKEKYMTQEDFSLTDDILSSISDKYTVRFRNTNSFSVLITDESSQKITKDIKSILSEYIKDVNIDMIYSFNIIENELVVRKKR